MGNNDRQQQYQLQRVVEQAVDRVMRRYLYGSAGINRAPQGRLATTQSVDDAAAGVKRTVKEQAEYQRGRSRGLIVGFAFGIIGGIVANYLSKLLGI